MNFLCLDSNFLRGYCLIYSVIKNVFYLLIMKFFIYLLLISNCCFIAFGNNNESFKDNPVLIDIYSCPYNSNNDSILINELKEKAMLMNYVEWTPKKDIPGRYGHFNKNTTVTGLPYSSVKELQKFIGLDVSIYTFLTAVNNPYSLLYSEDVAEGNPCYLGGTYNGVNSHTFYGTVCSSFTSYCYSENNNYTSYNYRNGNVPNYSLKKDQSIENISEGDLIWFPGHVALITDIEKDRTGEFKKISVFESTGLKVKSTDYSLSNFKKRISGNGNKNNKGYLYQNSLLKKTNPNQSKDLTIEEIKSILNNINLENQEISTWFGDRACIGEWDKLMINFQKGSYDKILISLNEEIVDTLDISNLENSIEYKYKDPGIYKAYLASDTFISPSYTTFEILDTTTQTYNNDDGTIEVIFAKNSNPDIIYWVDKKGNQISYPLSVSENDKIKGKMTIKPVKMKDTSVRAIYRGNYGRTINKPTHLFKDSQTI